MLFPIQKTFKNQDVSQENKIGVVWMKNLPVWFSGSIGCKMLPSREALRHIPRLSDY